MTDRTEAAPGVAQARDNTRGASLMLASVFTFTLMDVLIKHLGGSYPVVQMLFFRTVLAMLPLSLIIWQAGGLKILKTERLPVHLLRAGFGMTAMYCVFSAITLMPLADATAIIFAAPLFLTALSVPLLGEAVGPRRWAAVTVGFVGILVILDPGEGMFTTGAFFAVASALFMALAMIVVRKLGATEHAACISFYFTCCGIVVSTIGLVASGSWITPNLQDFGLLCMIGILGGIAQFIMTQGFRLAEAAVISPLKYTQMIWAALLAYLIWDEAPDTRLWIGAAIVIGSGLYMLHREAHWGKLRPRKMPKLRVRF